MKKVNRNIQKSPYSSPQIKQVKLDNEISLILESAPPEGPDEVSNFKPEYFNNDPFKTTIA